MVANPDIIAVWLALAPEWPVIGDISWRTGKKANPAMWRLPVTANHCYGVRRAMQAAWLVRARSGLRR